jgi:hypothetical protein
MTRISSLVGKRADLMMTLALGGAVATAVAFALASSHSSRGSELRSEDRAPATAEQGEQAEQVAQADTSPAGDDTALSGEVLETLPVSKYTYLRLRTSAGEIWAAVPRGAIAVGSHVAIENATRMDDFKSTTLHRTFPIIYFGALGARSAGAAAQKFSPADVLELDGDPALPPDHESLGASALLGPVSDSDPLPPGHPNIGSATAPSLAGTDSEALPAGHPDIASATPHGGAADSSAEAALALIPVEPAHGANAHDITELAAQGQKLAGLRVRVRGQVVKVTPDVNGRAFFHLRDSSGGAKTTDLVATALIPPKRGQVATFEGTLQTDVDVGIGYKYPVLLADATLLEESIAPL